MRGEDHHHDAGLISPAILVVVLALVLLVFGTLQVGLAADRSGRVQVAADAAALAALDELGPVGPGTPAAAAPQAAPREQAVRYAMANLPGLQPGDVTVTLDGGRVTVEVRDHQRSSRSPLADLPLPDNRATATAALVTECDESATPAAPGTPCTAPRLIARLVE